jgi:hypothetical protein
MCDSQHVLPRPSLIAVTAGERYVRLIDRHIHVLDFNPHHVRLELSRAGAQDNSSRMRSGGRKEGSVQVVHGRTLVKHGCRSNPWRKNVYTELPFVHTISKDPYSITAAMIDGERIIGVKVLFLSRVYLCKQRN